MEDDQVPTLEQRIQMEAGRNMALRAAVHALIATHPNPAAYSAMLDYYVQATDPILLTMPALQKNDGLRAAYSEAVRSLRSVIPQD